MHTDVNVTLQRQHALRMLLAMQALIQTGPPHLYLDQLRTGLQDTIWVLQQRLGEEPKGHPRGDPQR